MAENPPVLPKTLSRTPMSLTSKRLLGYLVYCAIGGISGFLCFVIPLSIMAVRGDPTGSGSGYFIAGLLFFFGPVAAGPATLISGLAALPIIDRALKATPRSGSDYARFLIAIVVSALIGIALTWLVGWLLGMLLQAQSDV